MPQFIPYRGYLTTCREMMQKAGVKFKRGETENLLLSMMQQSVKFQQMLATERGLREFQPDQDSILMMFECVHYLLSHRVYCVSTSLAERLSDTEISLCLDNLHLPVGVFEVCFSDDFELMPGLKAPSVLVMLLPGEGMWNTAIHFLEKAIGANKGFFVSEFHHKVFSIRFQSPIDGGFLHVVINADEERNRTIDEIIDGLSLPKHSLRLEPLNDTEKEMEKRLMRIVLGILCYLNTKEPDVKAYKDRNRPAFSDKTPDGLLLGESIPREVAWHLRKGHFRFLKAERYRRDEAGQVRCVWVRASEVNRDQKPSEPEAKVEIVNDDSGKETADQRG